jgi:hypothetical protein
VIPASAIPAKSGWTGSKRSRPGPREHGPRRTAHLGGRAGVPVQRDHPGGRGARVHEAFGHGDPPPTAVIFPFSTRTPGEGRAVADRIRSADREDLALGKNGRSGDSRTGNASRARVRASVQSCGSTTRPLESEADAHRTRAVRPRGRGSPRPCRARGCRAGRRRRTRAPRPASAPRTPSRGRVRCRSRARRAAADRGSTPALRRPIRGAPGLRRERGPRRETGSPRRGPRGPCGRAGPARRAQGCRARRARTRRRAPRSRRRGPTGDGRSRSSRSGGRGSRTRGRRARRAAAPRPRRARGSRCPRRSAVPAGACPPCTSSR